MGTSASEASPLLLSSVATASISDRVGGVEAVRERGTNEGVAAGFRFGHALTAGQPTALLATCFAAVKARQHTIVGDFGRDDLIEMGIALRPTVLELLAEARRQERARQDRERRARKDWVGNKI